MNTGGWQEQESGLVGLEGILEPGLKRFSEHFDHLRKNGAALAFQKESPGTAQGGPAEGVVLHVDIHQDGALAAG